jgi:HD-GYP domain-containing protein (c-di-GMP phosphodiesterase class II)
MAENISLETRILAVADIFDALYSDRPYREKLPISAIKEIFRKDVENGNLDAAVVKQLFEIIDDKSIEIIF